MRTSAIAIGSIAMVALVLSTRGLAAEPPLHLEGLDRVYFERVEPETAGLAMPSEVAAALPPIWSLPDVQLADVSIRDFPVLLRDRSLKIREVGERKDSRATRIWWALYDEGRRTDVWTFAPLAERTDRKFLTNYRLDAVATPSPDTIVLRVKGEMFRPAGAWSLVAREWQLHVGASAATLVRVRNPFGLFQDPAVGDTTQAVSARTEREVDGRIEIRSREGISADVLRGCAFRDPLLDDEWTFVWSDLLATARCLTRGPNAIVRHRAPEARSFGERSEH